MQTQGRDLYGALFDTTDDSVVVIERLPLRADGLRDFRYVALNARSRALFGVGHIEGLSIRDHFPDEDESWYDLYEQAIEEGEVPRFEREAKFGGMILQTHLVRVGPREDGRLMVTMRDVTARRRAETLLRESEVQQRFLLQLSDLLQTLTTERDLKAAAMNLLGQHLGVSRAQYHECDSSGFYDADGVGYANGIPLISERYRIDDAGSFVDVDFAAGRFFRSDDLHVDTRVSPEEVEFYRAYNIRAGAGIPLIRGGRLVAILAVHDVVPHYWTDHEMELMRETAERTWTSVERLRAEAALRSSEERHTFLLKLSDGLRAMSEVSAIKTTAMQLLAETLSADRIELYEFSAEEDRFIVDALEGGVAKAAAAAWRADLGAYLDRVFLSGDTVSVRDLRADRRVHAAQDLPFRAFLGAPILRSGRCAGGIGLFRKEPGEWTQDQVTLLEEAAQRTWSSLERAGAECALRSSEGRFQQFAQASSDVLWMRDASTMVLDFVSPAAEAIYGLPREDLVGDIRKWAALIVPDDRAEALAKIDAVRRGESVMHEFRIQRRSDKAFRWIRNTDFPLLGPGGTVEHIAGIATDVTDERLSVQHQAILLAELQHRVRNIMAMIRSVTARTADTADSVADYAELMSGRLSAMARTQSLLTHAVTDGVDLRRLLLTELEAQAASSGQYELTGPAVVVQPKAAEVLALAVHELTTNALKYGALAVPDGRVKVEWRVIPSAAEPSLNLTWTEERPRPQQWSPPTRRGFGTTLIEKRVPYELRGQGRVDFRPEGARAFLEFPLLPGASILETEAPVLTTVHGGAIDVTTIPSLSGKRVLIVEDDFYLATDLQAVLRNAGAEVVGPWGSEAEVLTQIDDAEIHAAIMDINLGSGPSFIPSHALRRKQVPFLFLTGYDAARIPSDFADVFYMQKPADLRQVVQELARLVQADQ
ncbi:PAS domain S-box-containing protein [Devosia crocina]|uniref:Blue-light-activated histidine kinase n=1 Tax=Devosia crocina TaxID=429728 RepID=A0A1I7NLG2_9HYPH|nr:GAF domain-containing protein [Devosia crocina]SFV35449.1 PAS domain S-box-containing protein [Devosia crocina]